MKQFSVIDLPTDVEVFDFTQGYDPDRPRKSAYGIGRYGEKRSGVYTAPLFEKSGKIRNIHMGIDIAAPIGTAVRSFDDGLLYDFTFHATNGDYGHTLITKHFFKNKNLYALWGHLSAKSIQGKVRGEPIVAGQTLAWIGDKSENGGWNPHLHIQLSWEEPQNCDMPGAVTEDDFEEAQKVYPDPQLVLGKLY